MPSTTARALTESQLRAALPDEGRGVWRDTAHPGLELLGHRNRASWYLRQTVQGRRIRQRLGDWPTLSHKAAREMAAHAAHTIAAKRALGVDVHAERAGRLAGAETERAEAEHRAKTPTLGEAIERYREHHLRHLRTGAKRERETRALFAPFTGSRLYDVEADVLVDHLEAEKRRAPAQTAAVLRVAKPMWRWIAAKGWADDLLAGVATPSSRTRDRDLSIDELARLWIASEAEAGITGHLVRVLILTAQRRLEIGHLRLREVDVAGHKLVLPGSRTKTGTSYEVPLSDAAVAELEAAVAMSGARKPGAYIFATGHAGRAEPGGPFDGYSRLKDRLQARAKLSEPWQYHDFRAAFVGRCAENGAPIEIVDRCLNHSGSSTMSTVTRRYFRASMMEQKRAAFDLWADLVASAVAVAKGANVVPLTRGGRDARG